jgi:hypothetical protein
MLKSDVPKLLTKRDGTSRDGDGGEEGQNQWRTQKKIGGWAHSKKIALTNIIQKITK